MKKMIPVLVAIVLIIVIAAAGFGAIVIEKYSYSNERADLDEYFGVAGADDVPIILQDERIEEHAKIWDNTCYFDFATVHLYFNDRFYEDRQEGLLLYVLPDSIVRTQIGSSAYTTGDMTEDAGYVISRYEGDVLYVAADFVKKYANFSYELFTQPYHMQVYTEWNERQAADITKDTQVRYQGGIKSDILTDVAKGDSVIILEEMENWTKVKTRDAYIGYVENKRLSEKYTESPVAVSDYVEPEIAGNTRDYKINLAWHAIYAMGGNDTLKAVLAPTQSVNVISPTWFVLTGNEGDYTSLASKEYVNTAHDMGLEVWALISNITESETIDMYELLGRTSSRTKLIDNLIATALEYDLDGINIDFESISVDAGEAFIEFIRELSIPCRANGIVLSVDNYVPKGYNTFYHRKEQGVFADYVIIMGYDEHHGSSTEAGSVASINYVEEGIAKTLEEVAPEKVINAIPFYTRIWETNGTEVTSQSVSMEMAEEYLANHAVVAQWDEVTCQNYGEYQSGNSYFQVWLEDEESIKVKLNVMENYHIGGVAEWRLGLEKPIVWEVIADYMNND
ncbi:MAG: glycosyl hydrolase family 18 protein [Bacillus sp. (in: Bacteria)]|nr:glycosyl hydrolase family 18 protein [Bacillus sp. (in: firmicutes)]MCM1425272.1 glycosyl hydrolase family 18 protein [Eubacterium sp.]